MPSLSKILHFMNTLLQRTLQLPKLYIGWLFNIN